MAPIPQNQVSWVPRTRSSGELAIVDRYQVSGQLTQQVIHKGQKLVQPSPLRAQARLSITVPVMYTRAMNIRNQLGFVIRTANKTLDPAPKSRVQNISSRLVLSDAIQAIMVRPAPALLRGACPGRS